jgi:hypothetical protein
MDLVALQHSWHHSFMNSDLCSNDLADPGPGNYRETGIGHSFFKGVAVFI